VSATQHGLHEPRDRRLTADDDVAGSPDPFELAREAAAVDGPRLGDHDPLHARAGFLKHSLHAG
jgi:hypothetical protein